MLRWLKRLLRERPRPLRVGDKFPREEERPEGSLYGGFIKVCPCCDRIDAIFIP